MPEEIDPRRQPLSEADLLVFEKFLDQRLPVHFQVGSRVLQDLIQGSDAQGVVTRNGEMVSTPLKEDVKRIWLPV